MASSKGIRAGSAFVEIGAIDKTQRVLRAVQQRFRRVGDSLISIGSQLTLFSNAFRGALGVAAGVFAKSGDQLDKMSKRTGIAVETLSRLSFASEQSGSNLDAMEKSVRRMQRTIFDFSRGLSTARDAFKELGLSSQDLSGLDVEEQFALITDRLGTIEDATKKAALAQIIFGRSGTEMIPLLGNYSSLAKEADRLGITMSTLESQQAARLTDAFNRLRRVLLRVVTVVGGALADSFSESLEMLAPIISDVIEWTKENQHLIRAAFTVATAVAGLGAALVGLGISIKIAAFAFGALAATLGVVLSTITFLLSPLGIMTAAFVGLLVWLAKSTGAFKVFGAAFGKLGQFIMRIVGGILDALKAGNFQLAGQIAMTALRLAVVTGLNALEVRWLAFKESILKIWFGLTNNLVQPVADAFKKVSELMIRFKAQQSGITGQALEFLLAGNEASFNLAADAFKTERAEVLNRLAEERNRIEEEGGQRRLELQEQLRQQIQQANREASQRLGQEVGDDISGKIQDALTGIGGTTAIAIEQGSKEDAQLNQAKKQAELLNRINESSMKQEDLQTQIRDSLDQMSSGLVLGVIG